MSAESSAPSTPTLVGLITGALAFVAALAWNDAIQRAMTALLGEKGATVWAGFLYAFVVTLLVVVAVWLVQRGQKAAKSLGQQFKDSGAATLLTGKRATAAPPSVKTTLNKASTISVG